MRIHVLTRLGLLLLALSFAAYLYVSRRTAPPALYPLESPLSMSEGAHFSQSFDVINPENYRIEILCLAVGPLARKGENDGDPEKLYERIPCDMYMTVSQGTNLISKRRVGFLDRGVLWQGKARYYLADVDINKPGRYELSIDNLKDLSFLTPTEPKLEVRMSSGGLESNLVVHHLLPSYCIGFGVLGLWLVGCGVILTKFKKPRGASGGEVENHREP
jgi:hypothetical protein